MQNLRPSTPPKVWTEFISLIPNLRVAPTSKEGQKPLGEIVDQCQQIVPLACRWLTGNRPTTRNYLHFPPLHRRPLKMKQNADGSFLRSSCIKRTIIFPRSNGTACGLIARESILFALLLLACAPYSGNAQSTNVQTQHHTDRVEQGDAEPLDQIRIDEQQNISPSNSPETTSSETPCIQVDRVVVEGVTLLSQQTITNAIAPFQGRCLGMAEFNEVLEQLTLLYAEKGFIASRAYLPQQDLSDGSLAIVVVEGTLEEIVINGQPGFFRGQIFTAFPGLKDSSVNLRDIEQGLDQINRLKSYQATVEIKAGDQPGGSILDISIETGKRWHGSYGLDNLGSASTGKFQNQLSLALDNVVGLNDHWTFSYQWSMQQLHGTLLPDPHNSRNYKAGFSMPLGYWTFGIDGQSSFYQSEIPGELRKIDSSGNTKAVQLNVTRVLFRDQTSKTSFSSTLNWKDNKNYILGSLVEVSSRTLVIANLQLSHSFPLWQGSSVFSIGHHRGLGILGAFDDDKAPLESPKGRFAKSTFSFAYTKAFKLGSMTAIYNGALSGQGSSDRMFGSEQMSLGGLSTIRGVREAKLFGNNASLMRNEFSLSWQQSPGNILGIVQLYTALDAGFVFPQINYGISGGKLCGTAIGLRNQAGILSFDLSYSALIAACKGIEDHNSESGVLFGNLSISI